MTRIQCFFLEPTDWVRVSLRRYQISERIDKSACTLDGYHHAKHFMKKEPAERDKQGYITNGTKSAPSHDDPRWPATCACGYVFQEADEWQRFIDEIYRRADTREETTLAEALPGAMWYAWWLDDAYLPQGKHNLVVKTPGGEWCIDSQASNCTMPDDRKQERHHCWIRHGTPPQITVDKQGGPTCSAGAGSIQARHWHGFLRNGYLED